MQCGNRWCWAFLHADMFRTADFESAVEIAKIRIARRIRNIVEQGQRMPGPDLSLEAAQLADERQRGVSALPSWTCLSYRVDLLFLVRLCPIKFCRGYNLNSCMLLGYP